MEAERVTEMTENEVVAVEASTGCTYKSERDITDDTGSSDMPCDFKTAANAPPASTDMHQHQQQSTSSTNDAVGLDSLAMPVLNEERTNTGNVLAVPVVDHLSQQEDTVPSLPTAAPQPQAAAHELPLILCSLSIDSLHCIASFLSPKDWSSFGQANHATNRVCNQVFCRVRMHGFRCATEVISAWKLGQYADARELSALYTKMGVPIYPYSLGHSYHTLTWRMGIEAREMETRPETAAEGHDDETTSSSDRANGHPVDRFYSERYDARLSDGYSSPDLTFMEEKSLFWYQHEAELANPGRNPRSFDGGRTLLVPRPPVLNAQGGPALGGVGGMGVPVRFPDFRPIGSNQSLDSQRQSASSFADVQPGLSRKPTIRIHRHLVDQHLLGRPSVDDENGAMCTAPVSLSADFYHPHIARRPSSPDMNPVESNKEAGGGGLPGTLDPRGEHSSPCATSSGRIVPPIPTPPPSNEVTPAVTPRRDLSDESNVVNNGDMGALETSVARIDAIEPSLETQRLRTPTQLESPSLVPPPLRVSRSPPPETPARIDHPVLSTIEMEIYSSTSLEGRQNTVVPDDGTNDLKIHLRSRFASYQHRLDQLLANRDSEGFEECILDFWDEFLPTTANIHFYDRYTAVPRVSRLRNFLSNPCPKAIGVIQCEIERIKVHSKKKGVNMKGRLFPSYEYRLFIRDRRQSSNVDNATRSSPGEPRRDTVLMTAKNKGKKVGDGDSTSTSSKKGVNNYYLYTPHQSDIDAHYNSVNETRNIARRPNGASYVKASAGGRSLNGLLGRLQSNFIGTEFQIFSHSQQKHPPRPSRSFSLPFSDSENEYDSGVSSDTMSSSSRKKTRKSKSRRRQSSAASEHPHPIDEDLPSHPTSLEKRSSLRRAMSLPANVPYNRSSRTSRRAIAHAVEPVELQPVQFSATEEEEGVITYTANLLGNRPRIMDVCIPKVSPEGVAGAEWKKYLDSYDDTNDGSSNKMLSCFRKAQARAESSNQTNADDASVNSPAGDDYVPPDDFGLLALQNRPPWWNIELGAFVLNFGGRVSVASVKNFQLCDRSDQDHIMLQFGRIQGRHSFTMDFQHPLTAVQAFAIAISSLQSKISFG